MTSPGSTATRDQSPYPRNFLISEDGRTAAVIVEIDPEARRGRALRNLARGGPAYDLSSLLRMVGFAAILTSNFKLTSYFRLLGGATILSALFADLPLAAAMVLKFRPRAANWEAFAVPGKA